MFKIGTYCLKPNHQNLGLINELIFTKETVELPRRDSVQDGKIIIRIYLTLAPELSDASWAKYYEPLEAKLIREMFEL